MNPTTTTDQKPSTEKPAAPAADFVSIDDAAKELGMGAAALRSLAVKNSVTFTRADGAASTADESDRLSKADVAKLKSVKQ